MTQQIYRVSELAKMYGVVPNTIREWLKEFADYVSDDCNPPKGKKRVIHAEDVEVLSLISTMKHQNLTYPEIHKALEAGERGTVPEPLEEDARHAMIENMKAQITNLKLQLGEKDKRIAELEAKVSVLSEQVQNQIDLHKQIAILEYQLEQLKQDDTP